jgi:predicted metal-binding protein
MKGKPLPVKGKPLDIVKSNALVEDAWHLPAGKIPVREWVREACRPCRYYGKSWSCPPGTGSLEKARKNLSRYRRAVFLIFKSSGNRKALEKAVLDTEAGLRRAGFSRARGFFVSPCTACPECSYPGPCRRPEACRPTGESWGMDLMETSRRAGLEIKLARRGEDFKPVTLILLD